MTESSPTMVGGRVFVLAVDLTSVSDPAVRLAIDIAGPHDALHVVHVVAPSGLTESQRIAARAAALENDPDVVRAYLDEVCTADDVWPHSTIEIHTRIGEPVKAIIQLAVDLEAHFILCGTHGYHGVRRVLTGSVAEELVRDAPCPVLVAKTRNFGGFDKTETEAPLCDACATIREQSGGETTWCTVHARAHEPVHTYSGSNRGTKPPGVMR